MTKRPPIRSTDYWETPPELFDALDREFNFLIDAAAKASTKKCERFISEEEDALSVDWAAELKAMEMVSRSQGSIWVNPPYSRKNIDAFMEKVAAEAAEGTQIVTLTRFDPSAKWFQKNVDGVATEVRMLGRRVKFVGAESAYNFPCCVSLFNLPYPAFERSGIRVTYAATNYSIWNWR